MIETSYKHIVLNENHVAMITGTRTKVIELILDSQAYGWSPEELQFQHLTFTMGQIHSALAGVWRPAAPHGRATWGYRAGD